MIDLPSSTTVQTSDARAVLLWQPESDESVVKPGIDSVAEFLDVGAHAVLAAIDSGELLNGWFVDWEVNERVES